jgi:hypothetical protein
VPDRAHIHVRLGALELCLGHSAVPRSRFRVPGAVRRAGCPVLF